MSRYRGINNSYTRGGEPALHTWLLNWIATYSAWCVSCHRNRKSTRVSHRMRYRALNLLARLTRNLLPCTIGIPSRQIGKWNSKSRE